MPRLKIERQKEIDQTIDDIKLKTGFDYPQNSILDITKGVGVEVYTIKFPDEYSSVNGLVLYSDSDTDTKGKIFINQDLKDQRRTFTIAHELGHYVLHNDGKIKLRVDKFDYSKDSEESQQETEANYFAASLLVPERLLRDLLEVGISKLKISQYFGVSESVIDIRKKWLKSNNI